jgi:SSS family solute:Na+ symporter
MMASFMSGMAGNVTAFNTVWTFDLYQSHIAPGKSDRHYLVVSKVATVAAVVLSVGTAYFVLRFNNLMDHVQLLFSFFNAPLFATFLLGMFTKWATPAGGLVGLVAGTAAAAAHYLAYDAGLLTYGTEMTANFYGAVAAWTTCFVTTIAVSLFTTRKPEAELDGLVYGKLGAVEEARRRPWLFAALILLGLVVLDLLLY